MQKNIVAGDLPKDIYRVSKENLRDILSKFNIKYRDSDTVADLRPIIADLKSYLKNNLTEEKKHILKKLIGSKTYLTAIELEKYPGLARIQEFIQDRDNLYDTPDTHNSSDEEYEDIIFPIEELEQGLEHNTPLNGTQGTVIMSKEKLPLISAGTYHGLPSENPNDFIDKYDIAAVSNHWTENTKINLFPAHLASTALSWYRHYSKNNTPENWENLKKVFIVTFTPAAQTQTLQSILERKVQNRDQPVLNYYLEVLTLCRRHDPDTTDKQIIQYVIQGLRPEYCDRILNETCETLDQLEKALKKIEIQIEIREQNREKFNKTVNVGKFKNDTQAYTQEINHLQTEIQNLSQIVANLNIQRNNQPQQFSNNRGMRGQYRGRGSIHRGVYTQGPSYQHKAPTQWTSAAPRQRGAYYGTYTPPWRSPTHTNAPRYQPPSSTYRGTNMYCSICRRNNHNTQDCRYKKSQQTANHQTKYCSYCRMNNHNREECYRANRNTNVSKNE